MVKLNSPISKRIFDVAGPVYENEIAGVWCGTVHDKAYGQCFVKVLRYGIFEQEQLRKDVLFRATEEAKCMKLVSQCSKQVPKIYEHWDDKKNKQYILIMQKMEGCTLRQWMEKHPATDLTGKDLYVRSLIVRQICMIMKDILNRYPVIVHRDLKPENIFIRKNQKNQWEVSIIDFGCANLNYIRNVGTVAYQAPEQTGIKDCSVKVTSKTDIFAIGQIFYELILGTPPIIGKDYRRRATERVWTATPEFPETVRNLPGAEQLERLLIKMTAFQGTERPIYDKIITELRRIQFR